MILSTFKSLLRVKALIFTQNILEYCRSLQEYLSWSETFLLYCSKHHVKKKQKMKPKGFNAIFVWLFSVVEIVFLQSELSISLCKSSLWHMTFFFFFFFFPGGKK